MKLKNNLPKAEPLKKWINRCSANIGKGKSFGRRIIKIPMILLLQIYTPERFGRKLDKLAHQYEFDKQEYVGGVGEYKYYDMDVCEGSAYQ